MVTKTKLTVCCLGLYVLATACFAQPTVGYDTLIAHRGEPADAPENTLPAYKMAVERGLSLSAPLPGQSAQMRAAGRFQPSKE